MESIIVEIKNYLEVVKTYPATISGQQEHFATVVPSAEAQLGEALRDEFDRRELESLRDFLVSILGEGVEE